MKQIIFTHSINSIVSKFTSLFLAIYFLKITDGNFASVALYYAIRYGINGIFSFFSLKLLNKDNVLKVYRLGILANAICLLVLLFFGSSIKNYIYLYAILSSATSLLYYSPYKIILYNFKNDEEFKKLFSYNSVVTSLISILSTIGMGYIIVNSSYYVLLMIIISLVFVALISTLYLKDFTFEISPIKLFNIKYPLKDKQAKEIYKIVFLEGMGFRGRIRYNYYFYYIFNFRF